VNLAEKRGDIWDDWGNVKVLKLPGLARMAGRDKPFHVLHQHGPPEMITKVSQGREKGPMAHHIVRLRNDGKAGISGNDHFVSSLHIPAHEVAVKDEEPRGMVNKFLKYPWCKIDRSQRIR